MQEKGIVIESAGGRAQVRIERTESCEGCHGCLYQESGHFMVADVVDRVGTAPGDRVRIETEGPSPVKASLLVFGVPLLMLFAGYAAGAALAPALGAPQASQGIGIAGAALLFAASFGVLSLVSRRRAAGSAGQSVIVEVLDRQAAAT
jgi:sigma-E factor negative regulatory protein RseC